jgi:hypothetical protein
MPGREFAVNRIFGDRILKSCGEASYAMFSGRRRRWSRQNGGGTRGGWRLEAGGWRLEARKLGVLSVPGAQDAACGACSGRRLVGASKFSKSWGPFEASRIISELVSIVKERRGWSGRRRNFRAWARSWSLHGVFPEPALKVPDILRPFSPVTNGMPVSPADESLTLVLQR